MLGSNFNPFRVERFESYLTDLHALFLLSYRRISIIYSHSFYYWNYSFFFF